MSETMNAGKRRAAVPVDSGVASGGRHRLGPPPSPFGQPDQSEQTPQADEPGRTRLRWFRRA